jgi:hypothetical protein
MDGCSFAGFVDEVLEVVEDDLELLADDVGQCVQLFLVERDFFVVEIALELEI